MLQRPTAVGLLLCEQMIVEEGTKSVTLVNSFSYRLASSFPTEPIQFTVVAFITDGLGDIRLEVVINRLDNLGEIYRRGKSFQVSDPLSVFRFETRVRSCSFPIPGRYEVNLFAGDEVIARRTILIRPLENNS